MSTRKSISIVAIRITDSELSNRLLFRLKVIYLFSRKYEWLCNVFVFVAKMMRENACSNSIEWNQLVVRLFGIYSLYVQVYIILAKPFTDWIYWWSLLSETAIFFLCVCVDCKSKRAQSKQQYVNQVWLKWRQVSKRSYLFKELMNFITRININKAVKRLCEYIYTKNQYKMFVCVWDIRFLFSLSSSIHWIRLLKKRMPSCSVSLVSCIDKGNPENENTLQ